MDRIQWLKERITIEEKDSKNVVFPFFFLTVPHGPEVHSRREVVYMKYEQEGVSDHVFCPLADYPDNCATTTVNIDGK